MCVGGAVTPSRQLFGRAGGNLQRNGQAAGDPLEVLEQIRKWLSMLVKGQNGTEVTKTEGNGGKGGLSFVWEALFPLMPFGITPVSCQSLLECHFSKRHCPSLPYPVLSFISFRWQLSFFTDNLHYLIPEPALHKLPKKLLLSLPAPPHL